MQESPFLEGNNDILFKLKSLPFLDSLGEAHVREILKFSKLRVFDDGEVITEENQPDCWLYLMVSGEVDVMKQNEIIVHLSQPGEAFGEVSMLDGNVRSATVAAVGKCVCLAINTEFLEKLPLHYRAVCFATFYRLLAELLAQRMRATNDELHRLLLENKQLRNRLNAV